MGCYKSKCNECGKWIKAKGNFELMVVENDHEMQEHTKIFEINKSVNKEYQKDMYAALEKKMAKEVLIFKNKHRGKWDPHERMEDEDALL